jgi:hypothetical protein
MDKKAFK